MTFSWADNRKDAGAPGAPPVRNSRGRPRRILIALAYVAVFWVLLPALLLAIGFGIDTLMKIHIGDSLGTTGLGVCLVLLGFLLMVSTMVQLWTRGKGLPISHLPPTEFVAGGWYYCWRHPIYVGYSLAFGGAALLMRSFGTLAFSTPLLWVGWIAYALFYEEPVLIRRFGDRYREYRARTPLLLPRWPLWRRT